MSYAEGSVRVLVDSWPISSDICKARSSTSRAVPMLRRLMVACASKQLKDFVYEHHELWSTINVVAEKEQVGSRSTSVLSHRGTSKRRGMDSARSFREALLWTAARREVRRLRVVVHDDDAENRMMSSRRSQRNLVQFGLDDETDQEVEQEEHSPMKLLVNTVCDLPHLTSLSVNAPAYSSNKSFQFLPQLVSALHTDLKQLILTSSDHIHVPTGMQRLEKLETLVLESSGGVSIDHRALPSGLKHLKIGGYIEPCLPEALTHVSGLTALQIHWAVDQDVECAVCPGFGMLSEGASWCSQLKQLNIGYFESSSLPKWLPSTLKHLEIQWNLKLCAIEDTKDEIDVDAFLRSFDVLLPLNNLTHLNLNNSIGRWGLPEAVCQLYQLQYLGIVSYSGDSTTTPIAGVSHQSRYPPTRRGQIASHIAHSFPNLKKLDIEICEAAAGASHLSRLKNLEHLRLGRGESPETYVRLDIRDIVGRGLIQLLPALPNLKEVQTEGMLLPATASCGKWNRLLGFEAEELRSQAISAVNDLHSRGVALNRWYAWPFSLNDSVLSETRNSILGHRCMSHLFGLEANAYLVVRTPHRATKSSALPDCPLMKITRRAGST